MEKLSNNHYIEMWKEWNKLIWLTPLAFLTILSVLGAVLKYIVSDARDVNGVFDTFSTISYALTISGLSAFICTQVLYKFVICRGITSAYISENLEEGEENLFRQWIDIDVDYLRGYDFLALFVNGAGIFLIIQGISLHKIIDENINGYFQVPFVVTIISIISAWSITNKQKRYATSIIESEHKKMVSTQPGGQADGDTAVVTE